MDCLVYNSLINRGLEGKLYSMGVNNGNHDEPVLHVIDMASGLASVRTTFKNELLSSSDPGTAISADAELSAHYAYGSLEQYSHVYDASGQLLHELSFISNNYSYEPESELRFSLANNDYIAWIYDDENFGTGAVVMELYTRCFVANWDARDYDTLAWTREGDLLLFDEGQAYRSRVDDGSFGNPELLFDFGELTKHSDVNPVNNDIAFSSGGQIFAIALDGQNVRRMTAYTDAGGWIILPGLLMESS